MPTPINQLLSRTLYATDGSTTEWDFSFSGGYISKSHIKALVEAPSGARTELVVTEDMLTGPYTLRITPALAAGNVLTIYRDTPKDLPLVDFTDESGFSEVSLDTSAKQAVFIAAETVDTVNTSSSYDAEQAAAQAATSAALADSLADGAALAALSATNSANAATVSANAALAASEDAEAYASTAALAVSTLENSLAASSGALLVGYLPAGTGAVAATVQDKLRRQEVDLADFTGADPTGATSSDAALQSALNTGKPINLGGPDNTWKFSAQSTYTGKVVMYGSGAAVKTDVIFIKVTDGTGSRMWGFSVYPVTTPYTIKRNSATWTNVVGDVVASLEGYIPSAQDSDIWAAIPAGYKTINAGINPAIYFNVSSAAGASDVVVSGIQGRQLSIILEGYTNSSVSNNDFGAGGLTYGGVVFVNGVNRAYNSAFLGYTLPRGVGNSADNNKIRYATLCGIVWFGNDGYSMCGNSAAYCGESGLKTYQYDGVAGLSETSACISTNGKIISNTTSDNFFDGLDAQIVYGGIFTYAYGGTTLANNVSMRNRFTGITCNGANFVVTGNHANQNGTHGVSVTGWSHTVVGNNARNNCTTGTALVAQPFDILVQGDDCVSYGNCIWNSAAPATRNYLHSGLLGAAPTLGHEGLDSGNYCNEGVSRLFVSASIPSSKTGVTGVPFVQTSGYLQTSVVTTVVSATYTVTGADSALSFYTPSACVVTLPNAAAFPGRVLKMRNTNAFAITSASSNVGQITGGGGTTALLAGVVGKWIEIQSNGTNWTVMAAN